MFDDVVSKAFELVISAISCRILYKGYLHKKKPTRKRLFAKKFNLEKSNLLVTVQNSS
jgi:hypothetical protein